MKLTIEQVSKLTKLSIPTLRVYVSRQKLGTKVGNNRFFSQADVQKLLKGTKKQTSAKSPAKTAGKPAKVKAPARPASKPAAKPAPKAAQKPAQKPVQKAAVQRPSPAPEKTDLPVRTPRPSFWSRLFGARKPKQRITVMDAKTTK